MRYGWYVHYRALLTSTRVKKENPNEFGREGRKPRERWPDPRSLTTPSQELEETSADEGRSRGTVVPPR